MGWILLLSLMLPVLTIAMAALMARAQNLCLNSLVTGFRLARVQIFFGCGQNSSCSMLFYFIGKLVPELGYGSPFSKPKYI